jgi:NTE family protein
MREAEVARRAPLRVAGPGHVAGLLLLLLAVQGVAVAQPEAESAATPVRHRPRIGLVLGGGGAKGAAHVGVLKLLDELRVPVDCVAGTSMGALVGGTFAAGSNATELDGTIRSISWKDAIAFEGQRRQEPMRRKLAGVTYSNRLEFGLRDGHVTPPSGLINTQRIDLTIDQLVARSRGVTDFDRLPIPFRAVATDMQRGEMVVLANGNLAQAMRASMSVPGVFAPVRMDDRLLGDGGLTRNLPVDIARETCADVVIAVVLPNPTPTIEEMQSPLSLAAHTLDILISANERQQIATLGPDDVLISVSVGDIGTGSFDKVDQAIPLGYQAALEHRAELMRYAVPDSEYRAWRAAVTRPAAQPVRLAAVSLEGLERVNRDYVRAALRLHPGDVVTDAAIARRVNDVYALGDFDTVSYTLQGDPQDSTLVVKLKERSTGPNIVRFDLGLYMGTDANTAFALGGDFRRTWINRGGGELHASASVGRTSQLQASLYQPLDVAHQWFVEPGMLAERSIEDVYIDNDAAASYEIDSAYGYLDLGRAFGRTAELRGGIRAGGQAVKRVIALPTLDEIDWQGYGGTSLRFTFDDRDRDVLSRSGVLARANYFQTHDWLGSVDSYRKLEGMLGYAWPIGSSVTYLAAAGGSSLGTLLPAYDEFLLGGPISFPGLAIGELRGQGYWTGSAWYLHKVADISDLFGQSIYFGVTLAAGKMNQQYDYHGNDPLYSAGIMIGGRTPIGPIALSLAGTTESSWQLVFSLGRPVIEHTIMDPAW